MILDLISLFVSFLCLLIFIMIIGSFKYNRNINIPFVIIILFVGIQRFQSSTSNLRLLESKSPFEEFPFFALIFIPLFLFFFKESINQKRTSFRDLSHQLPPVILILLKKVEVIPDQISRVIFFLYSLIYWVIILFEIKKYLMIRTNKMNLQGLYLLSLGVMRLIKILLSLSKELFHRVFYS